MDTNESAGSGSEIEIETGFQSLAELANMETDDIAILTSQLPPAGAFIVQSKPATLIEKQSNDPSKPNLYMVKFDSQILEVESLLDKSLDPEDVGKRSLKETFTLWPSQMNEMIGLLRGRWKLVGLDSSGRMGGIEGVTGWLDKLDGHIHKIRVRHFEDKNGVNRAAFDWLEYKQAEE